jgi:hypothetical protein
MEAFYSIHSYFLDGRIEVRTFSKAADARTFLANLPIDHRLAVGAMRADARVVLKDNDRAVRGPWSAAVEALLFRAATDLA